MAEDKDIRDMIEVLSISIVREDAEEQFYRRSASASSSQVVRDLFLEIAGEIEKHRRNLEERRERLLGALEDLRKADKNSREGL
jgi:rubrerythrin